MIRVLVFGGRNFTDEVRAFYVLDHYHAESGGFAVVIEGEADGADKLARAWAESRGVAVEPYPAAWDDLTTPPIVTRYRRDGTPYNVLAGPNRNTRMLREGKPTLGIAFPGGNGTADMIRKCHMAKVPVLVIPA